MIVNASRIDVRTNLRLCMLCAVFCAVLQAQVSADPLDSSRALVARGSLADAEKAVDQYLQLNPVSADGHYLKAEILFREKRPKESLAEFTEGAKGRRPYAREFGMIASDYVLLGDYADADRWFTEATTTAPTEATYWYLLGRTKYKELDYEAAAKAFDHALSLRPRYVEAENNRGLTLLALQKKGEAIEAFQHAIDWQGSAGTDAQPYFNLGTTLIEQNKPIEGIAALNKAATLFQANPRIHEELGRAYLAQEDLASAQNEFETAIKLSPDISSLHFKLGQIYRREHMPDLAKREFAICEKLAGTHSSVATPNPLGPETTEIK
jgi:tetratricopeptide (TPR) repeat protein